MSDDEDFWLGPSDPETQFIPKEDDDETLWEVIEITAEKGKLYKVRWKGIDPRTRKPWPQSWVAKQDCTDDLVREWKLKQGKKKERESGISKKSSGSAKATASVGSTRRSTSTAVNLGLGSVNTPAVSLTPTNTGTKRKHVETTSTTTSARNSPKSAFPPAREGDARPHHIKFGPPLRKKRKLEVEIVNNIEDPASSPEVDDKGKTRNISSRVLTADDDIDDIDNYVEVESEVEQCSGHSKMQRQNLIQPAEEREEELDDGIESLSEIYYSLPPSSPIHNQDDQGTSTPSVRAQSQAHKQQDTSEESILTVSPSKSKTGRTVDSFPIPARITSKLDPPSKKSASPSSPSSSSDSTDSPPEKSVPDQASRSRAESAAGSGSHPLTERGTKKPISIASPLPRVKRVGSSGPSTGIPIPTPPRDTDSGADDEDGHISPLLSAGTKERLEQFDRAVMQIELRNGKAKEQRLEDGSREQGGEENDLQTSQTEDKRGASPPQPLEIEKKKKNLSLFLPDESDSNTKFHARLKPQAEAKNQNGKSGSKEKGKEQLNKHLSSHHPSDFSRLADGEEAEDDSSSSTDVGSADTKHTDSETFNASSKTVSKTSSKPQSKNTAQTGLPPSTAVRRLSIARSNSFVHDIIPETDESRSQSQETDMQVPTVSPTTPPPVNMKFALESRMKAKIPLPKPRSISRTSSAVKMLAPGVQIGIDMDVGNDVDERLNGKMDDVDGTIRETCNKISDLAMIMESSGAIPMIPPRKSKSRSRSRSISSQKGENVKEPVLANHMTLNALIRLESLRASQRADSQRGSAENSFHLGPAMHLLNSKLEDQLSAEQRKNEDLLQQLSDLQRHITESTSNTSSATMTLEQDLAEARAQLALQTESWENERATLNLNIETANRGKVSAEQDRDFFREQYTIASGFVSSVRDENTELEKQIKIATEQAHSGVSLIKTTFELRTKSLEEDVRAWRRIAEFLMDKDHRTNDDIRRRAAEEPELRARCDRQESALEDFSERQLQSEMDLKERLFVEAENAKKGWQEMTAKLNLDLNEAQTKLERIGKVGETLILESPPPTPEHWRSDDSIVECEAVYLNIMGFQDRNGHLHLD